MAPLRGFRRWQSGNINTYRAHGQDELDVTAYLDTQKDWDLERDHGWIQTPWLYEFHLDHELPEYEVLWMFHEGRVVLSLDNHPVKNYRDIPLTVSSKVEGALMEAIRRLDPRIVIQDFWARLLVHSFKNSNGRD